jgi:hypothetical protein
LEELQFLGFFYFFYFVFGGCEDLLDEVFRELLGKGVEGSFYFAADLAAEEIYFLLDESGDLLGVQLKFQKYTLFPEFPKFP